MREFVPSTLHFESAKAAEGKPVTSLVHTWKIMSTSPKLNPKYRAAGRLVLL
jgi:hypothetical protein